MRATSSAQKAGFKFRASSGGRSAHEKFQRVSGIRGLRWFVHVKRFEFAMPAYAKILGEDVVGTDGEEAQVCVLIGKRASFSTQP